MRGHATIAGAVGWHMFRWTADLEARWRGDDRYVVRRTASAIYRWKVVPL